MITLKSLLYYVTFMSVCVRYIVCVYDAADSLEVLSTYDEELLTTSINKNFEDDYQTADVTSKNYQVTTTAQDISTAQDVTTAQYITTLELNATTSVEELTTTTDKMSTTVENTFTTVEDYTTVQKFVYRTNDLKAEPKKKAEKQVGKVYAILESFISDSDKKTENKEDGEFEDMTEEIATVPYEVTTNLGDYVDVKFGDVISVDTATIKHVVRPQTHNPQCPYFIDSAGFQIDKIANVWQPVYSDMHDKLPCFKILIRKTLEVEREQYEQWYGNFNNSMNWKECRFEIKSAVVKYRKHFLQGGVNDKGVMRNMLLVQNKRGDYDLAEENPDQWLMVKNLLFLHDCKTDETIAFARVPSQPCKEVVTEALQELGLKTTGEMLSCHS
ncbi:hypothetical protein MSG28_008231 [Choristoneura fumiferana]|uniref:Uncharacterized protein n=1 Tax=Choristoneura fumiferana TaxID=7141 RepID=A0ACC0JAP2_CHOFU|nr:hypothetical protein MSG28_008231 [Choristoneura fumiferana]